MDINGQKTLVRTFIIVMIGDMPQRAGNSGFMRHSAQQGCRSCFCDQSERSDLDFSTLGHCVQSRTREPAERF
jgi:hypothetical protein